MNYYGNERDESHKSFVNRFSFTTFYIHGNHEKRLYDIPTYKTKQFYGSAVENKMRCNTMINHKNNDIKRLQENNNIVCFYHEDEENGCFSNWYRAEFEYAGKHFASAEQFMMYHKVMMFQQYDLGDKILSTENPSEIKKLGRTHFANFNADLWECACYAIVKRGVRAKFEQNTDILQKLLDTEEMILAECSLNDKKWGIGIAIDDLNRYQVSQWNGKNYLGRILMEVRDELRCLSALGKLGYVDARNIDFPLWHSHAGTLQRNPKFYATINAYADTLKGAHARNSFLYEYKLSDWDIAMATNMGGGLPIIGFYEMKQDIFESIR